MGVLLKIAQGILLKERGLSVILLLDDFITDFDELHMRKLLDILHSLGFQLVFTCPSSNSLLEVK